MFASLILKYKSAIKYAAGLVFLILLFVIYVLVTSSEIKDLKADKAQSAKQIAELSNVIASNVAVVNELKNSMMLANEATNEVISNINKSQKSVATTKASKATELAAVPTNMVASQASAVSTARSAIRLKYLYKTYCEGASFAGCGE